MNDITKEIESRLFELADPEYKEFHTHLVPGYDMDTIIGVRTPPLRKLAAEFVKREDIGDFLSVLPQDSYWLFSQYHFLFC